MSRPTKAEKLEAFEAFKRDFNETVSKGVEPCTALEMMHEQYPLVSKNDGKKFLKQWEKELHAETEDAEGVTGEEVRFILQECNEAVVDDLPASLAIQYLLNGEAVTRKGWGGTDGFPRIEFWVGQDNESVALKMTNCAGATARAYSLTNDDLLTDDWSLVA